MKVCQSSTIFIFDTPYMQNIINICNFSCLGLGMQMFDEMALIVVVVVWAREMAL
jgi:hypothetical protein